MFSKLFAAIEVKVKRKISKITIWLSRFAESFTYKKSDLFLEWNSFECKSEELFSRLKSLVQDHQHQHTQNRNAICWMFLLDESCSRSSISLRYLSAKFVSSLKDDSVTHSLCRLSDYEKLSETHKQKNISLRSTLKEMWNEDKNCVIELAVGCVVALRVVLESASSLFGGCKRWKWAKMIRR